MSLLSKNGVPIHFFNYYGDTLYEGLKPKMAIFGATVDEVVNEIKPAVEGVLNDLGIDLNTILVNVGESTITHDNDIYNFNNFILWLSINYK